MDLPGIIKHVETSILNAYTNKSSISNEILQIEGMSGNKTRHLYNNICSLKGSTYLEVGTWKGSSFISAMYNNNNTFGFCIDNWSEFGGPRGDFFNNVKRYLTTENVKVIDKDCWLIDNQDVNKPIDIFLCMMVSIHMKHKKKP